MQLALNVGAMPAGVYRADCPRLTVFSPAGRLVYPSDLSLQNDPRLVFSPTLAWVIGVPWMKRRTKTDDVTGLFPGSHGILTINT